MKRVFLLFFAFFLISCSFVDFSKDFNCPFTVGKQHIVLFEYQSALLNDDAIQKIEQIAVNAKQKNDSVCLFGNMSYDFVPKYQAMGAEIRMNNVEKLFIKNGVSVENIYKNLYPKQKSLNIENKTKIQTEQPSIKIIIGR